MATSGPPSDFWERYYPPELYAQREFPTDQMRYFYYPPRPELPGPSPTPPGGGGPDCRHHVAYIFNAINFGDWHALAYVEISPGGVAVIAGGDTTALSISLQAHDLVAVGISISNSIFGAELDLQYGAYVTNLAPADIDPGSDPGLGTTTDPFRVMPGAIVDLAFQTEIPTGRTFVITARGSVAGASSDMLVGPPYTATGSVVVDQCNEGGITATGLTLNPVSDDLREAAYEKHDWSPPVAYLIRIGRSHDG